jgi:hypothetical protein
VKEAITDLLCRRLPLPGVVAWTVRLADRSLIHQSYNDWFNDTQLAEIITRISLAADGFGYHGIQPLRLCWVFEHARIYLALRPDGPSLMFIAENQQHFSPARIEAVFDEFSALPGPTPG